MRRYCLLLWILCFFQILQAAGIPKREIRGVWLTTIYGLDWPRRPASTEATRKAQQEELCHILDRLQEANFNVVFLQVRLRGDVIYRSAIESATKTFSGKYGVMPGYDPLAFAIEECHKRGMECHAWFVTFPVGTEKQVKEQGETVGSQTASQVMQVAQRGMVSRPRRSPNSRLYPFAGERVGNEL